LRSTAWLAAFAAAGITSHAWAAPCCAGSSAAPALITGDEASLLSATISQGSVIGDAWSSGLAVFRDPGDAEVTRTLKLEGALLLSDRWQAGATLPLVQHDLHRPGAVADRAGLGDVGLSVGYEALPEWTYTEIQPRGWVFLRATLPTGRSALSSQAPGGADVTGQGLTSVGLGALLLKRWSRWDVSLTPEFHVSVADAAGARAGVGAGLGLAVGRRLGDWRVGVRTQPQWDGPRKIQGPGGPEETDRRSVWETGLDVTAPVGDDWSLTAAYTDETLLGPARNTSLSRTVALTLQTRWDR
jgi:hypothetical protein